MTQTLDFKSYTIALCQSIFKSGNLPDCSCQILFILTAYIFKFGTSQFGIVIVNTETKSENIKKNMWVI